MLKASLLLVAGIGHWHKVASGRFKIEQEAMEGPIKNRLLVRLSG